MSEVWHAVAVRLRDGRRALTRPVETRLSRGWWLPLSLGIAVISWPVLSLAPGSGLDSSWQIALHLAAMNHHLHFGRDIIFPYGPLGFLSQPLLVSSATGIASFVYAVVAQVALCAVVLRSTLRVFGWPLALIATYLSAAIPGLLVSVPLIVVFFGCVWALERDEPPTAMLLIPVGGLLSAFQLLLKVNGGALCLPMLALTVWRLQPRRLASELLLIGSFGVSLVAMWWLTGNAPGNLPTWLQRSSQVSSGYSAGMAVDSRAEASAYIAAVILIVSAVYLLIRCGRLSSRWRTLCLAGVAAIYLFGSAKEGFVRHDPPHDVAFLGLFGVGVLAFDWRRLGRASVPAVVAGLILASVLLGSLLSKVGHTNLYRPDRSVRALAHESRVIASRSRRASTIRSEKASVRSQLGVSPAIVSQLRSYSVDVEPYLTSAVWAYGLRWRPEPVLQSYTAYTASLDRFNATFLANHGPPRVLRESGGSIDNRDPDQEAPASFVALLCHYHELQQASSWFVFGRVPNRCGHPRLLARRTGSPGQQIAVPSAPNQDDVVYARIRLRDPLFDKLRDVLFKPYPLPTIMFAPSRTYRFEVGTADDPLVLRLPPRSEIAAAFGNPVAVSTVTLANVPAPFEIEFFAMSLARLGG